MITHNDITIYVAAKKSSAPKLPLREALVTVALECVYEPKHDENNRGRNRRRVTIANFFKRPRQKRKLQACTLYSHEQNNGMEKSLSSYIEERNNLENRTNDGVSTLGASTLSSQTMMKFGREESNLVSDLFEVESYTSLGIPSLALSDDDEDIEDMTMDTYALIGGITTKPIPGVIITKDDEQSDKWWYEDGSRISSPSNDGSLVVSELHMKNGLEMNESKIQSLTVESFDEYTRYDAGEGVNSHSKIACGDDVSVILSSAFASLCPKESLLLSDDHDLMLTVDSYNGIELSEGYVSECNMTSDASVTVDSEKQMSSRRDELFTLLSNRGTNPADIKMLLDENPHFIKTTRLSDGKLPLHVMCGREICQIVTFDFITSCIEELSNFRMLLKLISWCHIEACGKHDSNGDLPSHILARNFIKWILFCKKEILSAEIRVHEMQGIRTILNILSECMDIVLRPISTNLIACSTSGSKGKILPLHISIIFSTSIDVFKRILETYPQGAGIPLSIDTIGVLMPLELIDKMNHDNAGWKKSLVNSECFVKYESVWCLSLPSTSYDHDIIRKADLIFCFSPTSSQADKCRLARLNELVKYEIKQERGSNSNYLSPAARSYWVWITAPYKVDEEELKQCDLAFDYILQSLEPLHVKKLASIELENHATVLDSCRPSVQEKLFMRMQET
jgi:hypothetical protein